MVAHDLFDPETELVCSWVGALVTNPKSTLLGRVPELQDPNFCFDPKPYKSGHLTYTVSVCLMHVTERGLAHETTMTLHLISFDLALQALNSSVCPTITYLHKKCKQLRDYCDLQMKKQRLWRCKSQR